MRSGLTPLEAVLHRVAKGICALPRPVQEALGGGPIVRDGERLEPELLLLRRIGERSVRERPLPPAVLRAQQGSVARIAGGPKDDLETRDLVARGAAGELRARHYVSDERGAPLLVYFHGGGFVFGDVSTHDAPCRLLCRHSGAHVVAVEYRLAPEHPFPAPVEDARAALRWAFDYADKVGADASRVALGGDSAGANLATVAATLAAKDGGPAPCAQLLIYPPVDRLRRWASLDDLAEGFYLTRESIEWFHAQYMTPARVHDDDPRLNPLRAPDLSGLAPALVVTAGFDPLRDEGEAYAKALADAGNKVVLRRFGGLVHGFFNMVGISRVCREAVVEIAGTTRALLTR